MKNFKQLGLYLAFLWVTAVAGQGANLMFVFESRGSGSLAGQAFGPSDFRIVATADTDDWQRVSASGYLTGLPNLTASIEIDGLGDLEIISETHTLIYESPLSGARAFFGRRPSIVGALAGPFQPGWVENEEGDWVPNDGASLAAWDRQSSLGPISGPGQLPIWPSIDIASYTTHTDEGILALDGAPADVRFTVIPEPHTEALIVLGSIVGLALRRKVKLNPRLSGAEDMGRRCRSAGRRNGDEDEEMGTGY